MSGALQPRQRLLARLYFEGLASGDFEPVFRELVDGSAALSPSSILRLKQEWADELGGQAAYERLRHKTEARVLAAVVSCTPRHLTMRRALLPVGASPP